MDNRPESAHEPAMRDADYARRERAFNRAGTASLTFDGPVMEYPRDRLMHEIFEHQVQRTPQAVALEYEGQAITFDELNTRANQVAHALHERGVGPDQRVALCADRSLEMIIGLLGTLKAGGAYVPLDPAYPLERLEYMLEDAAPRVLLAQESLLARLPRTHAQIISLDGTRSDFATRPGTNLTASGLGLRADHLAYIIYTSGSTGQPKGVMIEHRSVINFWAGLERVVYDAVPRCQRIGLNASLSFDASVQQLVQLLSGRSVIIVPQHVRWDAGQLITFLREHRLDAIDCTPSQLRSWIAAGLLDHNRHAAKVVLVGGEAIDPELWSRLAACQHIAFYNMYGPTECTVDATVAAITAEATRPHVGRPLGNRRVYILDADRQPLPARVVGELYIGGAGVARGYWNRPDLTEQRFSADPFSADPHARMYRTGDLGRWQADANLEYLGRNDDQVKVRGYRIELGEIQARLTTHELLEEAVVVVREDTPGEKRLVAYFIPKSAADPQSHPTAEMLRAHLGRTLPDYMVPSAFVALEKFPLTPSGKLDKRALPMPPLTAYASRPYEAPQGDKEHLLASLWQGLLQVDHVGRWDNFFELGGHSLLVVKLLERLREAGVTLDVRNVFESATLSELAQAVAHAGLAQYEVPPNLIPEGCEAITPSMLPLIELEPQHIARITRAVPGGAANIQDIYPLAPLQEGILFHHKLDEHSGDTYVLPVLLRLSSHHKLEQFLEALQRVIDRHDSLRTAVLFEELPRPVQVVHRHAALDVKELVLDPNQDAVEQLKERMRPEYQKLDLSRAPLVRVQVAADAASEQWFAILQLHHVASDHESVETMLAEIKAYVDGPAESLPAPVPYRNHVAQALAHARTYDAEAFFRAKLGDVDEPTAPFRLLDVRGEGARIRRADDTLDLRLARRTRREAQRLRVSAATLFHAAWALVVARSSGRDDVVFGTVLLGRLHGSAGAQRMLGMFINTLPLRLKLDRVTARALIQQTQRELADLLGHEQASLSVAQRCSGVGGSAPLFSTLLNYLHSTLDIETGQPVVASGIRVVTCQEWTSYPIALSIYDQGDGFGLMAKSDQCIDPRRITTYLSTALEALVDALERTPEAPALGLPILPREERHELLETFNAPSAPQAHERLIHELFEEQARRTPARLAVVYPGRSLTFAQLNRRANQLARVLQDRGIGPDELVGICAERSVEMIVAVLAVLKAGGAYVPLDPDYPTQRLAYMLEDAAPKVLLTQATLIPSLPQSTAEVIALDQDWDVDADSGTDTRDVRAEGLRPDHLAYVIYTSGSTGQPKGVMIEHRNVASLCEGLEPIYRQVGACQRVAVNASFNFDASVKQWVQLLSGRTVCPVPQDVRADPALMLEFLQQERIDAIDCTPSQLKTWLAAGLLEPGRDHPRLVLVGGEQIDPELWRTLAQCRQRTFYNVYGPTESTVDTTFARLNGDTAPPHIGAPMQNRRVYILDGHRELVPRDVVGELYIGGAGVARGYWKRPDLTAQRFSADPFCADPQARLYRTGDLGQWRANGTIEYVGRNDQQVKIRGFRIELGDIEAQLVANAQVKQAVVTAPADDSGEQRLVAYLVADFSKLKAEHEEASKSASAEIVAQWNKVHDETYASGAGGPSFVGWNSSDTGEPIPESEMREWLASTVRRIQSLRPTRVLEIGCGVGLLLQHLAPKSKVYVATDFSAAAIAQLQEWISKRDDLKHVEALHRSATELDDLQPASFEVIVLNSVVQYFPDIEYLITVLQRAVPLLSPGGKIFIGDVRHLGSLPVLHAAIQLSKAAATVTVRQLRGRIARSLAQEKELVLDPQFFAALPGYLERITAAEVQLKRGHAANELTRYRYDVVLHTEQAAAACVQYDVLNWRESVSSVAELGRGLRERRWRAAQLTSIPNARLVHEQAALQLIEAGEDQLSASAVRRQVNGSEAEAVDPEALCRLAEAEGYEARITLSAGASRGCFDAYLLHDAEDVAARRVTSSPPSARRAWSAYANDPLESGFRQQLIPQLREDLKAKLPDYMIPGQWVVLKNLPLMPSGKVDRRALPAPQTRGEELGEYVPPQTELERRLAQIWAEVLQLDQVGAQDDFFGIGGHSLLAMQVVVRIRSALSIDLPMRLLFECPTIRQLAVRLEDLREAQLREAMEAGGDEMQELLEEVAAMSDTRVKELMQQLRPL